MAAQQTGEIDPRLDPGVPIRWLFAQQATLAGLTRSVASLEELDRFIEATCKGTSAFAG